MGRTLERRHRASWPTAPAIAPTSLLFALALQVSAQEPVPDDPRVQDLMEQVEAEVEARTELLQQMVDRIFSFSELGFQEVETSRYIVEILREHGFEVEEGIA